MGLIRRTFVPIYTDAQELVKDVSKGIRLLESEKIGCCFYPLKYTKRDIWAIVIGYSDVLGDELELCAKVAFQPLRSLLQCDFDIDWDQYVFDNDEVCDTIRPVSSDDNIKQVVDDLLNAWEFIKPLLKEKS